MNLILTLTGAILLIQAIKIILPQGTTGKYVSFVLGLFFMTVVLDSAEKLRFPETESMTEPFAAPSTEQTEQLETLQQAQIFKEYEQQLTEEIRRSIPQLQNEQFSFTFSDDPFGSVQSMVIRSHKEKNETAVQKISESYGIPQEVISWETN